jgi:glycerol uptake facilitator-like aquaporin
VESKGPRRSPGGGRATAGWGNVPFQVNGAGWWTIYIAAPVLGGLLGGGIYAACFRRAYAAEG